MAEKNEIMAKRTLAFEASIQKGFSLIFIAKANNMTEPAVNQLRRHKPFHGED